MTGVSLSSDGRLAVTVSDHGVSVWDLATVKCLRQAHRGDAHIIAAHCARFGPDGQRIFSGWSDGRISVQDMATGAEVLSWEAHRGPVSVLAISSDGRLLASGGEDGLVRLWDASTGRELARWEAHDESVTALAFSGDGRSLATGSAHGSVRLWNLPALRDELTALGLGW
jgi:WD40 repeat protein